MKIRADKDGIILSEVYSGVGIETDQGVFGICERDGGIEVLLDSKLIWSSRNGSQNPLAVLDSAARIAMAHGCSDLCCRLHRLSLKVANAPQPQSVTGRDNASDSG